MLRVVLLLTACVLSAQADLASLIKTDCDPSKNNKCVGLTDTCIAAGDCEALAVVSFDSDKKEYSFQVASKDTNKFVALGFAKDGTKVAGVVVDCKLTGDTVELHGASQADEKEITVLTDMPPDLVTVEAIKDEGVPEYHCKFNINNTLTVDDYEVNVEYGKYNLILSVGTGDEDKITSYKLDTTPYTFDVLPDNVGEIVEKCKKDDTNCLAIPEDCIKDSKCLAIAMFEQDPDTLVYNFRVATSNPNGFVGLGFSNDDKVGSEVVIDCLNSGNVPTLSLAYDDDKSVIFIPDPPTTPTLKGDASGYPKDLNCNFNIDKKVEANGLVANVEYGKYTLALFTQDDTGKNASTIAKSEVTFGKLQAGVVGEILLKCKEDDTKCVAYPEDCISGASCLGIAMFELDTEKQVYNFRVATSNKKGFVGLGFSTDDEVGDEVVLDCWVDKDNETWSLGYDDEKGLIYIPDSATQNLNGNASLGDSDLSCYFNIEQKVAINNLEANVEYGSYKLVLLTQDDTGKNVTSVAKTNVLFDTLKTKLGELQASCRDAESEITCIGIPEGCHKSEATEDCVAISTFQLNEETYTYAFQSATSAKDGHVALGFAETKDQEGTPVVDCVNTTVTLAYHNSTGYLTVEQSDNLEGSGTKSPKDVSCIFNIKEEVEAGGYKANMQSSYYLVLSYGENPGEDTKKTTSTEPIQFNSATSTVLSLSCLLGLFASRFF